MSAVTIHDGVAIITTPTRRTEVHLSATAGVILEGYPLRATKTDLLAMSAGYLEMEKRVGQLEAELEAARAGTIGREHAEVMQGARKALAELNAAAEQFMAVYDQGDAPDSTAEGALRNTIGSAINWLISDSTAASQRAKVLEGGAQ